MNYEIELTDTYGGEANYCWVKRAEIDAETLKQAVRKAKKHFGYGGIRHKRSVVYDGDAALYFNNTVIFVTYSE